ncbi:hypothetical protein WR25_08166 [Diploscapter pachys]|uniref:Uncharacterized protein n=1 Tax=Diploscapter pachys TaxID=2018661 RepID=A0A2A2M571_9BILA|nr:hypothetical protein WR25_08166 [Diploscapter pachys]
MRACRRCFTRTKANAEMDLTKECWHEGQTGQRIDTGPRHEHERAERHHRTARSRPVLDPAPGQPDRPAQSATHRASPADPRRPAGTRADRRQPLPAPPTGHPLQRPDLEPEPVLPPRPAGLPCLAEADAPVDRGKQPGRRRSGQGAVPVQPGQRRLRP